MEAVRLFLGKDYYWGLAGSSGYGKVFREKFIVLGSGF
jgi:hypothetical protein